MIRKVLLAMLFVLAISSVYAFPVSVETILTNTDGTAKVGTFTANFSLRSNTTSTLVYTNTSTVTTDVNGRFHKLFDIPFFGNDTLDGKWHIFDGSGFDESTNWTFIGWVPYAINAMYLQGYNVSDFALATSLNIATGNISAFTGYIYNMTNSECPTDYYVYGRYSNGSAKCRPDSGSNASSGDITAVIPGTGITGGATSGDATVNLNTSYVVDAVGNWSADKNNYLNQTTANSLYAPIGSNGTANTSWNESYANTLYAPIGSNGTGNSSWNETYANTIYAPIGSVNGSGNSSWNESYANSLYLNRTNEWIYLSTYNATYAAGSNASWNETRGNELYIRYLNTSWVLDIIVGNGNWSADKASYNASIQQYAFFLNRTNEGAYLSTYNATYAAGANATFNQTLTDYLYTTTYNATYANYNASGLIKDWNLTGVIINYNGTGYLLNWNSSGFIRDWNSSGFIKNDNISGVIINHSAYINASGLIINHTLAANATGFIINWNGTGYLLNWNASGYLINWNSSGFIKDFNTSGFIKNWNISGVIINYSTIFNTTDQMNAFFLNKTNEAAYTTTYNASYMTNTYNATYAAGANATFNQTLTDSLYTTTYNATYANYNASGLIKDWNITGVIINHTLAANATGFIKDWNSSGYIKDWNITGVIVNYSTIITSANTTWNETRANALYLLNNTMNNYQMYMDKLVIVSPSNTSNTINHSISGSTYTIEQGNGSVTTLSLPFDIVTMYSNAATQDWRLGRDVAQYFGMNIADNDLTLSYIQDGDENTTHAMIFNTQSTSQNTEYIYFKTDNNIAMYIQNLTVIMKENLNVSGNITATKFIGDGSSLTAVSTYNSTYANYNASGLIKDWNLSGYLINWNGSGYLVNWNATGYIRDWNTSGVIRDWNSSGFIKNDNISGVIINHSAYINASGLIINHTLAANATGLIINWNASGYLLNWNSSGFIRDWNSSGFIKNWNISGVIVNYSTIFNTTDQLNAFFLNRSSEALYTATYNSSYMTNTYNATYANYNVSGLIINYTLILDNNTIVRIGDINKVNITYQNITNIPLCTGSQKLTYNASGLVCSADELGSNTTGDINAVYAGTGLIGGSESGDATLSLNTTYVTLYLDNGTILRSYNTTWINQSGLILNWSNIISTSGNSSWNETYAFTLFLNRSSEALYTTTYNASYMTNTYNSSYMTNTYNATYANYNASGLIKDWNISGYLLNWNGSGYLLNWNTTGFIKDWNLSGFIKDFNSSGFIKNWNISGVIVNYSTIITSANSTWNETRALEIFIQPTNTSWVMNIIVGNGNWSGDKASYNTSIQQYAFYLNRTNENAYTSTYNSSYMTNTYNATYANYNASGLIKDWNITGLIINHTLAANATGYIINWNSSGFIKDWNTSGVIRDWNSSGLIKNDNISGVIVNYSTIITSDNTSWNETRANQVFVNTSGNGTISAGLSVTGYFNSSDNWDVSNIGLLLAMNFNNRNSNGSLILDSSGYNNHGNASSGLVYTNTSIIGGAYNFSLSSDKITIPISQTLNGSMLTQFTIMFYVNGNMSTSGENRIFSISGGTAGSGMPIRIQTESGNSSKIFLWAVNSSGNGNALGKTVALNNYTWYHIAWSFNGTQCVMYLNGQYASTSSVFQSWPIIGAFYNTSIGGGFNGTIDELRIYNRSLSSSEISAIYDQRMESPDAYVMQRDVMIDPNGNLNMTKGNISAPYYMGNGSLLTSVVTYNSTYDANNASLKAYADATFTTTYNATYDANNASLKAYADATFTTTYNSTYANYNTSGFIKDWNITGVIINYSTIYNSTGYVINWNSSGFIKDFNTSGFIKDWNITGVIINYSTIYNSTGYVINWNSSGFIKDWNGSGYLLNWNATGVMLNYSSIAILNNSMAANISGLQFSSNGTDIILNFSTGNQNLTIWDGDTHPVLKLASDDNAYFMSNVSAVYFNGQWNNSALYWSKAVDNSSIISLVNSSGVIRDWNSSGFIKDWNISGVIVNYNGTGYLLNWNSSGFIKDWNSSTFIKDWNISGYLLNWNGSGYLLNWNSSGFIRDWNSSGFIKNWNISGVIINYSIIFNTTDQLNAFFLNRTNEAAYTSTYNSSYMTNTYNATYDANNASLKAYTDATFTTTYNATYASNNASLKAYVDANFNTTGQANAFFLNRTNEAAYTTTYNASYMTNTYNSSYITNTYNATYDANNASLKAYADATFTTTYNATYANYNTSGLIKDWNISGVIINYSTIFNTTDQLNVFFLNRTNEAAYTSTYNSSYMTNTYNATYDSNNASLKAYADATFTTTYNATYASNNASLKAYVDANFNTTGQANAFFLNRTNEAAYTTTYNASYETDTYNATYANYNASGLIKDWNLSGYLINWNGSGYLVNWNGSGYIINWNSSGFIKNWNISGVIINYSTIFNTTDQLNAFFLNRSSEALYTTTYNASYMTNTYNASYITNTYNATYDANNASLKAYADATFTTTYNSTYASNNASLKAYVDANFNTTSQANAFFLNRTNEAAYTTTYNASYMTNTYNATYAAGANATFNQTLTDSLYTTTYNATYANYNTSGLIKDWNISGVIINHSAYINASGLIINHTLAANSTGYIKDWNSSGFIKDWNSSGVIVNYSLLISGGDNSSWNKSYADTLYAPIGGGSDNTSWNQSYANTLYLQNNTEGAYNLTSLTVGMMKLSYNGSEFLFNSSSYNMTFTDNSDPMMQLRTDDNVYIFQNLSVRNTIFSEALYLGNVYNATGAIIDLAANNTAEFDSFESPYLHVGMYENLLYYSEAFNSAIWNKTFMNLSIVGDSSMAPYGTKVAEYIPGNFTGTCINQTVIDNNRTNYTFSIYMMAANTTSAWVNISIQADNHSVFAPYRVFLTNQWERYMVTQGLNNTHKNVTVVICNDQYNISAWGAQLEHRENASSYISQTTTLALQPYTATYPVRVSGGLWTTGAILSSSTVTAAGMTSTAGVAAGGAISGATTIAASNTETITIAPLQIPYDGLVSTSTTAATTAAPIQMSPRIRLSGTVWDTGSKRTNTVNFMEEVLPVVGTNYTSGGSNGSADLRWMYGYNTISNWNTTELMRLRGAGDLNVFGLNVSATNVLSNGNFSFNSTNWSINGGWQITNASAPTIAQSNQSKFNFTLSPIGNLSQNSLNYTTPIKPNRWYKLSYNISQTGVAGCLAYVPRLFSTEDVYLPGVSLTTANQLKYVYLKTNSAPGNFTIVSRCTAGYFFLDTLELREIVTGDVVAPGRFTGGGPLGLVIDGMGNATFESNLTILGNLTTIYINATGMRINGTYTETTAIRAIGNTSGGYYQMFIQNMNASASSDFAATSSIGNDSNYYMDIGITGPSFNDTSYYNITPPNTSYILSPDTGIVIATGATNQNITFAVGSFTQPTKIMNITSTGLSLGDRNISAGSLNVTSKISVNGALAIESNSTHICFGGC